MRASAYLRTNARIMHDHQHAVARDMHVQLDRISAGFDGIYEAGNRVFGMNRASAAVPVNLDQDCASGFGSGSSGGASLTKAVSSEGGGIMEVSGSMLGSGSSCAGAAAGSAAGIGSVTLVAAPSLADSGTSHSQQSLQRLHRVQR